MMCDSCFEATGTECAADVYVEAGPDLQSSQLANDNLLMCIAGSDQSICAGQISHLSKLVTF